MLCYILGCTAYKNVYTYMSTARLEEAQAGVKTAGRNINNLSYADDITLMAESEEELKSLRFQSNSETQRKFSS